MFIPGHLYRRSELHNRYGGQRQGGISTPAHHPLILLFTGASGEQHGYTDGWSGDGLFLYTGEGQQGDMMFVRGNAAIRDHLANGKDLHLFTQASKGYVRYLGQIVCTGYHMQEGPDTTGQPRQMIVFAFTPLSAFEEAPPGDMEPLPEALLTASLSLENLRTKALADAAPTRNPVERQTFYRQRSQWIRLYALRRAHGQCEGCGSPAPFSTPDGQPYLEVHPIRRLSDGGPDHPRGVVAICPNCHRRAHYAEDAETYNAYLSGVVEEREERGLSRPLSSASARDCEDE
jgi:5-methylcytosine-specific restriction protein A